MTDTSPNTQGHESSSMEVEGYREVNNRLVLPEDGYEWKKYGQKFNKNIAKIRSYFKCRRSSCRAKKKVDWSDSEPGNVKIVYEGEHNHGPSNLSGPQETSSTSTTPPNPYDLLTQVRGDNQT